MLVSEAQDSCSHHHEDTAFSEAQDRCSRHHGLVAGDGVVGVEEDGSARLGGVGPARQGLACGHEEHSVPAGTTPRKLHFASPLSIQIDTCDSIMP